MKMELVNKKTHSHFRLPTFIIGIVLLLGFMIALFFITNDQSMEDIDTAAIVDSVRYSRASVIQDVEFVVEGVNNDLDNEGYVGGDGTVPVGTELSFPDKEYIVFDIPDLTRVEIGGLWKIGDPCGGTPKDHELMEDSFAWMEKNWPSAKESKLGYVKPFTLFGPMSGWITNQTFAPTILNPNNHRDTTSFGADILNSRFVAGFGRYFSSDDYTWAKFDQVNNGGCYDVVLKDGTVIPFVRLDNKADSHTNNKRNSFYPLLMPEYEHLFQSVGMEMFEIFGTNLKGQQSVDVTIRSTYNITEDNPIVSMVLYNVFVDQLDVNGNFESETRRK